MYIFIYDTPVLRELFIKAQISKGASLAAGRDCSTDVSAEEPGREARRERSGGGGLEFPSVLTLWVAPLSSPFSPSSVKQTNNE